MRSFHFDGLRGDQPLVEVNCAAAPADLLEAELFGFERGSFTHAQKRKIGLIESADGGTLFLDEIAELEIGLQSKLLRFLDEGRIRRIGGLHSFAVDVRIVAATNRDLNAAVKTGGSARIYCFD